MPNGCAVGRSFFDSKKKKLFSYLKREFRSFGVLCPKALAVYGGRKFVAGWKVTLSDKDVKSTFHILIDSNFPYSPIRIAYKTQDTYLKWPHVEAGGVLCLPVTPVPASDLESAISTSLFHAIDLVQKCQDQSYVNHELQSEFLSYWGHARNYNTNDIRTILDLKNQSARIVYSWHGKSFTLIADTPEQLNVWLDNYGANQSRHIVPAIIVFLGEPLIPPFMNSSRELIKFLMSHHPDIGTGLSEFTIDKDVNIVMAAEVDSEIGLIGCRIKRPNKLKGPSKRGSRSLPIKKQLWYQCEFERVKVERLDSSWIHSRAADPNHVMISESHVVVIGCGSLGSQVAVRLAQSGVGRMTLIDSEKLSATNVGRHALGVRSINAYKSNELAQEIQSRFPHVTVESEPNSWQVYFGKYHTFHSDVNLFVVCLGEWAEEGPLSDWYLDNEIEAPIVYGWLDERGVASHAIALNQQGASISCIRDEEGILRLPETEWDHSTEVQAEPACGTLFQPYGAVDVTNAESLVTRLCLDLLSLGKMELPVHRVYAGSCDQIKAANGKWSETHMAYRPENFKGAFKYERSVSECGKCIRCEEKSGQ